MRTRGYPLAGVMVLTVLLQPHPVSAGGMEAQRIVARKATEALPDTLRTFFLSRLDGLLERAIEPDGAWREQARFRNRNQWHYLMLDAAAADVSHQERMRAALAFPSKRSAARRLFRDHDVKRGGKLVWKLHDLVEQLTAAFESGDQDEIVKIAGYVIHFSADAADPFCATRNRHGQETGNLIFGDFAVGHVLFAHQNVAQRTGWELVRRNAERYRECINATSLRFEVAVDVPPTILETMVEVLDRLDDFAAADREILESMRVADGDTFLVRADEYYQLLDAQCGEHTVQNLRAGACLAATLIVGAWQQAGEGDPQYSLTPLLAEESDAAPHVNDQPPPQAEQPAQPLTIEYVASKNSKIYHRSDCQHATRISPENLIHFADKREAEEYGKRPCHICRPDKD